MCSEEGLLTNFPQFHGDHATSTMFSQPCRKTYRTDLVCTSASVLFGDYFEGNHTDVDEN